MILKDKMHIWFKNGRYWYENPSPLLVFKPNGPFWSVREIQDIHRAASCMRGSGEMFIGLDEKGELLVGHIQ